MFIDDKVIDPDNKDTVRDFNEMSWDLSVEDANKWTVPTRHEAIERARNGDVSITVTPVKKVPSSWLGELKGKKVLGLASGGGQQAPILAAAGADVTVLDLSSKQLEQDSLMAEREGLKIRCVQSSADDLSMLDDQSFDLIVNPVSTCFFPDLPSVWKECRRIIKPEGSLLSSLLIR